MWKILYLIALITNLHIPIFAGRTVVIADVHGDINRFRIILKDAGVVDKYDNWIASPNTTVIQLGDQIDPKNKHINNKEKHHFDMIYYTDSLQSDAEKQNSTFISVIGNHEHMNIKKIQGSSPALLDIIAKRPIVFTKGNNIFCHASVKMHHYLIMQRYNVSFDDINNLWFKYVQNITTTALEDYLIYEFITGENSIIYTKTPDNKHNISALFDALQIDNMFVGHLVSKYVHMKHRIWYLDQFLENAFDDNIYTYITIQDNDIVVKSLKNWHWTNYFNLIII